MCACFTLLKHNIKHAQIYFVFVVVFGWQIVFISPQVNSMSYKIFMGVFDDCEGNCFLVMLLKGNKFQISRGISSS